PGVRCDAGVLESVGGGAPAAPPYAGDGEQGRGELAAGAGGELERQVDAEVLRRALFGIAAELAGPGDAGTDPGDREGLPPRARGEGRPAVVPRRRGAEALEQRRVGKRAADDA